MCFYRFFLVLVLGLFWGHLPECVGLWYPWGTEGAHTTRRIWFIPCRPAGFERPEGYKRAQARWAERPYNPEAIANGRRLHGVSMGAAIYLPCAALGAHGALLCLWALAALVGQI